MPKKYTLEANLPVLQRKPIGRIYLTKKAISSESGKELLDLLFDITLDGDISAEEVIRLYDWLNSRPDDFPAFGFLKSQIEAISADGKITPSEMLDLYLAIERVLPKSERQEAESRRIEAGILINEPPPPAWYSDPITERQKAYLTDLGADWRAFSTKGEASQEIARRLNGDDSVSNRQMMVLRFWDMVSVAKKGRSGVTEWMDHFYSSDPDYIAAWNLWKEEHGDVGRQSDPNVVQIGIGTKYLAKVKSGDIACSPPVTRESGPIIKIYDPDRDVEHLQVKKSCGNFLPLIVFLILVTIFILIVLVNSRLSVSHR